MHEMKIAKNIIEILKETLSNYQNVHIVSKVNLKIGKLHAIIPESLKFCYEIYKKDDARLNHSVLSIEIMPIKIYCPNCQQYVEIDEPIFLCPNCFSNDIKIVSGNELYVESIEIDDEE